VSPARGRPDSGDTDENRTGFEMKLQQLRYLVAVVDNGLNITAAAQALFTSQPGVSKQIRLLEDELQLQLFIRKGKSLADLTDEGQEVVRRARLILGEVNNIKSLSSELSGEREGQLVVATTHTQARYVLPEMLAGFHRQYPSIAVNLHQGTSDQIARQVQAQDADFAIASGSNDVFGELVSFPIYTWERIVLAPPDHPLTRLRRLSLEELARYPIISYTHSFDPGSDLEQSFGAQNIRPNVVFSAEDPDVIKTYVRKGMGVGILACMAYDRERDSDLVAISAARIFPTCTTWVGFHKDRFLREYMYAFLKLMVPGAERDSIDEAVGAAGESRPASSPLTLKTVNHHPMMERTFSNCCAGDFNL
jgi:LysR family cys regulon transcriptional activator